MTHVPTLAKLGTPTVTGGPECDPRETAAAEGMLLARLRAGENEAFEELIRMSGGRMLAVARRMLGREEEAADAVQEAFLSAWKSLDRFDGRSCLATWLHRIVVNACLMRARSRRRRPERSIEEMLPEFVPDGHQAKPTRAWRPENSSAMERAELRAVVREKIDELPEMYRVVLLLRDIEELDTAETATVLGLTTHAVKTRLHRARQALRELVNPVMIHG